MRVIKYLIYILCVSVVLGFVAMGGGYLYLTKTLPAVDSLSEYNPSLTSKVFATDGQQIGEFFIERRTVVPLEKVPFYLIEAFLAAEDAKFYQHEGIDYAGIARAFYKNIQAGRVVQGGSTITQQVAKSFFLTPERTISRKIREAFMAHRIEESLTKDEILHLYLNQIYFGNGAYGVQAASETYFGKDVSEITMAESALLAALPKAPSRYSPYVNPEGARKRQLFVIRRMREEGFLTAIEAENAAYEEYELKRKKPESIWVGPYFTEHIRRYIENNYGQNLVYKGGLRIYTTLDVRLQKAANNAVSAGLLAHDKRRGYRGAVAKLTSDEEVTAVLSSIQAELGAEPPKMDKTYKAVITSVSPKASKFYVQVGNWYGTMRSRDMRWARLYNPTNEPNGGVLYKLTDVLIPGDLIEVRVRKIPKKLLEVKEEILADEIREAFATDSPEETALIEEPPPLQINPIEFILYQEPLTEAALFAMEPQTGYVRAMVGGSSFEKTEFNRAIQAKRQPGSAFKPIIYSSALDKGYTPASIVVDSPLVFEETLEIDPEDLPEDAGEEIIPEPIEPLVIEGIEGEEEDETEMTVTWKPRNFEEKFHGPTTIRTALTKSRNVITIKVLRDIGVDHAISYARKLGITSPLARDLSLALGSSSVSLKELTTAFATFANLGKRPEPIFITKITDINGNILEENEPAFTQALSPQTAYIMTSLLKGVVEHGTGWRARALKRPSGGKTGTTNNLNDAWYMGFVPDMVTGVWIGYDSEKPLGHHETGSKAAAPIWVRFMKEAIKDTPIRDFDMPDGVEFAKIDPETGLLAAPNTENAVFEVFKVGTKPTRISKPVGTTRTKDFFIMDAGGEEERSSNRKQFIDETNEEEESDETNTPEITTPPLGERVIVPGTL